MKPLGSDRDRVRLLVDQQLPIALARWQSSQGLECVHVQDIGFDAASDATIWQHARAERFTILSKDDNFQVLANRHGSPPQVVWVRLGNCRKTGLLNRFPRILPDLLPAIEPAPP